MFKSVITSSLLDPSTVAWYYIAVYLHLFIFLYIAVYLHLFIFLSSFKLFNCLVLSRGIT